MTAILGIALAMVFGLVFNRVMKLFNLPSVTGYLAAGIIVGPYCVGLLSGDTLSGVSFITDIALGFIAFSIGGEFKLSSLKSLGPKVLVITFTQALGAVALVMCALFVVRAAAPELIDTPAILLLSAIATATAPAATLMVVRQFKARGVVTDTLLPVVAFDDAIGLMVFAVCSGIAKVVAAGAELTVTSVLLMPLFEIFVSIAIGAALGFLLTLCCRLFRSRANRLCCMVTLVLAGVGLCELDILGGNLSSLLTCMMIGAVFVNTRNDAEIILEGSERWTPPLFMLFFVISGATLDLAVIPKVGVVGIVYIVFRSLGKYFGAFAGAAITKADKQVRNHLGITLLPQAGVAIGMAQIVANTPEFAAIAGQVVTVTLCATLVYELVGPLLTKMSLKAAGEITERGKLPVTELVEAVRARIAARKSKSDGDNTVG